MGSEQIAPDGSGNGTGLGVHDEITVLLAEYNRLAAEIKMYIEQYSPKFTIFGTLILSAFAFAVQHSEYQMIYVVIPLFIFLIGYVQIAQVHILTAQAGRIRSIEARIRDLNAGRSILQWESKVALKLLYPPLIHLRLKDTSRTLWILNPLFTSVVFVFIAVMPVLSYSTWKAYVFLPAGWRCAYAGMVIFSFALIVIQGFMFFAVGRVVDKIDYDA